MHHPSHAHPCRAPQDRAPTFCSIAPPHILARMAESDHEGDRAAALRTLSSTAAIRAQRELLGQVQRNLNVALPALSFALTPQNATQSVYDVSHGGRWDLPGALQRKTGQPETADPSVNEAFDAVETTFDFYREVHERNSIDSAGMEIVSSVHYGTDYDNAAWIGTQMIYGDGGRMFLPGSMTKALDVIAHELTHGITQMTANLEYHDQPGALNESFSDVFGSLVKQRKLGHSAADADWLIGEGILGPALNGRALRSLKEPGSAFDGDNQPAQMSDFVELPNDNDPTHDSGGVHINSGIPNHAFYLAALALGGNAWEKAGHIWYETLTTKLHPTSDFAGAADATLEVATAQFGAGSTELQAVDQAWKSVGVL